MLNRQIINHVARQRASQVRMWHMLQQHRALDNADPAILQRPEPVPMPDTQTQPLFKK
ncbi:hypothetical protein [Amantichitinum ursilacus]|uniref:Uncharacterized protein n=1 Tax=Amantichitinum ursilacus TaxID=857265 RepID=A0A0N0GP60_9NEIS|nr:hypothetical protein [Amantichitinum ursilacus]KPC53184.1 hypothetical protein WG78_08840 [Amantichitinum ursilacus]